VTLSSGIRATVRRAPVTGGSPAHGIASGESCSAQWGDVTAAAATGAEAATTRVVPERACLADASGLTTVAVPQKPARTALRDRVRTGLGAGRLSRHLRRRNQARRLTHPKRWHIHVDDVRRGGIDDVRLVPDAGRAVAPHTPVERAPSRPSSGCWNSSRSIFGMARNTGNQLRGLRNELTRMPIRKTTVPGGKSAPYRP